MATATELSLAVGRIGSLCTAEGLHVRVRILDARQCWNRYDLRVEPLDGAGQAWVAADLVLVDGPVPGRAALG